MLERSMRRTLIAWFLIVVPQTAWAQQAAPAPTSTTITVTVTAPAANTAPPAPVLPVAPTVMPPPTEPAQMAPIAVPAPMPMYSSYSPFAPFAPYAQPLQTVERPRWWLVMLGAGLVVGGELDALITYAQTTCCSSAWSLVPLVGPWVAIGNTNSTDPMFVFLNAVDGVVEDTGALLAIAGLVWHQRVGVMPPVRPARTEWRPVVGATHLGLEVRF